MNLSVIAERLYFLKPALQRNLGWKEMEHVDDRYEMEVQIESRKTRWTVRVSFEHVPASFRRGRPAMGWRTQLALHTTLMLIVHWNYNVHELTYFTDGAGADTGSLVNGSIRVFRAGAIARHGCHL